MDLRLKNFMKFVIINLILKVKGSNEILGGYNPIAWRSNFTYGTTKDSFIFSFKKDCSIENYILSRVGL